MVVAVWPCEPKKKSRPGDGRHERSCYFLSKTNYTRISPKVEFVSIFDETRDKSGTRSFTLLNPEGNNLIKLTFKDEDILDIQSRGGLTLENVDLGDLNLSDAQIEELALFIEMRAEGLRPVTVLSRGKNGSDIVVSESQYLLVELEDMIRFHDPVVKRPRFTGPGTRTRRVVRIRARARSYRTHRKASTASTSADDGGGGSGQGDPDSSDPPKRSHSAAFLEHKTYSLPSPWPRHGCLRVERERAA
jgi:hypothetical protein